MERFPRILSLLSSFFFLIDFALCWRHSKSFSLKMEWRECGSFLVYELDLKKYSERARECSRKVA